MGNAEGMLLGLCLQRPEIVCKVVVAFGLRSHDRASLQVAAIESNTVWLVFFRYVLHNGAALASKRT